eukprot:6194178-Pleurochrysis_carterae.AAC.1
MQSPCSGCTDVPAAPEQLGEGQLHALRDCLVAPRDASDAIGRCPNATARDSYRRVRHICPDERA